MPIPDYSGKPISTAVGINLDGIITGTRIVHHEEPILVVGVTAQHLARYTAQYVGKSVNDRVKIGGEPRAGYETVDGISGATITVMVINRTIMAAARKVAETRGIPRASRQAVTGSAAAGPEPRFDPVLDPIWGYAWRQKQIQTVVLVVALVLLSLILVFQDWLARYPRLLLTVRDGYLMFTLLFIGWYGLAQLSVVNVLTFVHAAMHGFSWDVFLVDPMMFLLWGFVAVTVVLWGRGVYCGWLCPFGAVQELVHQIGQRLGVRSLELPQMLHERLWAIKYVIFIALFGLSLESLGGAARFLEVEPFKTAITLRFHREWPFVLYAGGLVAASVFNRKFYCRYLCPLGAALTFPGRFRIFDWLRRRKECGRPCQICAEACEVRAISPTGEINANECHYCLDCQVTFWNDRKCPPLVERRKRRERQAGRARRAPSSEPVPVDLVLPPAKPRKG